jgi:hypothetical protein
LLPVHLLMLVAVGALVAEPDNKGGTGRSNGPPPHARRAIWLTAHGGAVPQKKAFVSMPGRPKSPRPVAAITASAEKVLGGHDAGNARDPPPRNLLDGVRIILLDRQGFRALLDHSPDPQALLRALALRLKDQHGVISILGNAPRLDEDEVARFEARRRRRSRSLAVTAHRDCFPFL